MSLIAMAVYSTAENSKDDCLERTLESLSKTIDPSKHQLILSVNAATDETHRIIERYSSRCWADSPISEVIYNEGNLGTARAINKVWALRQPGEHCIKMDDDIVIHYPGWIEEMEAAIQSDPHIGQVGLKRKDCWEHPTHENKDFRSTLHMLPHTPGHPWQVVEKVKHVIGSCVMHSSALIDKCGGLFQFGQYGYDDVIYSHKCHLAGFYSCFLPHINIDHIDQGDTPFQSWKERHAGEHTQRVIDYVHGMYNGINPIYHPFE